MFNMGMMISLEENIVTIIASFRNINAFDQPGVQDGKIATDNFNLVSKSIEKFINENFNSDKNWSGDALEAKNLFNLSKYPTSFIDSILSDMTFNKQSYFNLKK